MAKSTVFQRRDVLTAAATLPMMSALPAFAQTPFRMKRGYAEGPFGLVHFCYVEKGRPVVFLHQAQASFRQFNRVYPMFVANGFQPIGIDLPGYGGSDPDPTKDNPTVENWAGIVAPVLDQLRVKQADVVGHHTGSPIAASFALQHPERVRKLVLHGTLLVTPEERAKRLSSVNRQQSDRNYKADGSHLSEAFVSRSKLYGPGADPKMMTEYTLDRFSMTAPPWHGTTAIYTFDTAGALSRIKHPTLVINNTGDQIYEVTTRVQKLRPDFGYVEMKGGTVDAQDQMSGEWVEIITKFLNAA